MQIDRVYYPVETLGYGKRIGIWTIGCSHGCHNCSNPELWSENKSKDVSVCDLIECIKKITEADGITITGGDPFEQPDELLELVIELKRLGYIDVLVYTGYTLEELNAKGNTCKEILSNIGILIDGMYIDELNDNKSIRGSSNQHIYIFNERLRDRYMGVEEWERKSQILVANGWIQTVGLPMS